MRQKCSVLVDVLVASVVTPGCVPTDAGIGTKVRTNLTADETVKAAAIDVGVEKKIVTLSGTVDTATVKERAVAVARGTGGVANVVDQITIKQRGFGPGAGYGREMMERRWPKVRIALKKESASSVLFAGRIEPTQRGAHPTPIKRR